MTKLSSLIPLFMLLQYVVADPWQRFGPQRRDGDGVSGGNGTKDVEMVEWPQLKPKKIGKACNYTFDDLYKLQTKFLDAFIYPANLVQVGLPFHLPLPRRSANEAQLTTGLNFQAKSINSSLFSPDVQGRVDITRTFKGRELNTEYIFGLFANLAANANAFTLLGYATSYEIVHFAASQNIASASTRYSCSSSPLLSNFK